MNRVLLDVSKYVLCSAAVSKQLESWDPRESSTSACTCKNYLNEVFNLINSTQLDKTFLNRSQTAYQPESLGNN